MFWGASPGAWTSVIWTSKYFFSFFLIIFFHFFFFLIRKYLSPGQDSIKEKSMDMVHNTGLSKIVCFKTGPGTV